MFLSMKTRFVIIDWAKSKTTYVYLGSFFEHWDKEYVDYCHNSPYRKGLTIGEYYFERHNS